MLRSPSDHDELVLRVERLVAHTGIERGVIAGAVDRVLGTLAAAMEPEATPCTVVVMAESMPDLASRLRAAVPSSAAWLDAASATEGRHTVFAVRVAAGDADPLREAAGRFGARVVVREALA